METNYREKISRIVVLVFSLINYLFIYSRVEMTKEDPSSSLGAGLSIIMYWGISSVILFIIVWITKINAKNWINKVLIFIATPIPSLIFFFTYFALQK